MTTLQTLDEVADRLAVQVGPEIAEARLSAICYLTVCAMGLSPSVAADALFTRVLDRLTCPK